MPRARPTQIQCIVHISGPSGAGKTTLGKRLKSEFRSSIVVKDIDDLRTEFIQQFYGSNSWTVIDKEAYQQFIDAFVAKQTKPIIFVGLNHMPWWHKQHYYDMHSTSNWYITIDDKTLITRKCKRLLTDVQTDKIAMEHLIHENQDFIRRFASAIRRECSLTKLKQLNKQWNTDYKRQGYKFASANVIYNGVVKLLRQDLRRS